MALINNATREITAKIVYYGPGLGGKTTNLKYIYDTAPIERKGKMISLATETDRTLFFDFLPIELGRIKDFKTRVQLYTVPGQVFYDATRKLVLQGVDGVVFVADSQIEMLQSNIESMENLRINLAEKRFQLENIPLVVQFNKRDLPNIMPVDSLNHSLNPLDRPNFEASALLGHGVTETFHAICRLVLENLGGKFVQMERETQGSAFRRAAPPEVVEPSEEAAAPQAVADARADLRELLTEQEVLEPGSARAHTENALADSIGGGSAEAFPMDAESETTMTAIPRPTFEEDYISLSDLEEIAEINEIIRDDRRPVPAAAERAARVVPPPPPPPSPPAEPIETRDAVPAPSQPPVSEEPLDALEEPLDLGGPVEPRTLTSPAEPVEIVVPVDLTSMGVQKTPDSLEIKFTIKLVFKR